MEACQAIYTSPFSRVGDSALVGLATCPFLLVILDESLVDYVVGGFGTIYSISPKVHSLRQTWHLRGFYRVLERPGGIRSGKTFR